MRVIALLGVGFNTKRNQPFASPNFERNPRYDLVHLHALPEGGPNLGTPAEDEQ